MSIIPVLLVAAFIALGIWSIVFKGKAILHCQEKKLASKKGKK